LDSSFTPGSANAGDALDVAIEHLSSQRAMTNSQENVLTHRKEALLTYQDNIASAEAKIRNVDMANESINYSRQEILVNTSKAILAQANIMPLNILDLLPK
jgi:flagellin